ncbi:MAG: hypothetical protein J7518_08975 [Nocardioidaceae bacterium]|nr:hypothetical protein [Nocardioidaceae bacterium]
MVQVEAIAVDDDGIRFRTGADDVVDVCFDGRRVWSFWLLRDSVAHGTERLVSWPSQLTRFLHGTARLSLVAHVSGVTLYDETVRLGNGEGGIKVEDEQGRPLALDKSNRISLTFETRTPEQVAPLLDAVQEVLDALREAGVQAFPAYGTLLGAVRDGALIGHDNDADLGYVSEHSHPVDAIRESFALQRFLGERGYDTQRYSGIAFKVDVIEADGSRRGLDVFGGFIAPAVGGRPATLYLMGEVGAPFEKEWIFPLGTTTLEGRTLPAPARPEKLLEAMYGPGWKVPDPAFKFETPRSVVRRLDGWFRGIRVHRNDWDRRFSTLRNTLPTDAPSDLAQYVVDQEGVPAQLVDLGAGRAGDALWFARQGSSVTALDFVPWASAAAQRVARAEGLDLRFGSVNLHSYRSWLAEGSRLAHVPGPRTILCRHLVDAGTAVSRDATWRLCEMALREGGRLYLEFLAGEPRPRTRTELLSPVPVADVVAGLEGRGAVIVHREDRQERTAPDKPGRPVARLVAEWRR